MLIISNSLQTDGPIFFLSKWRKDRAWVQVLHILYLSSHSDPGGVTEIEQKECSVVKWEGNGGPEPGNWGWDPRYLKNSSISIFPLGRESMNPEQKNQGKKKSPDFTGGRHRTSTFSSGKSVILLQQSVILLQQSSVTSNLTIPFPTRYCTGICLGNRQGLGFSEWISPLWSPFSPPGAFGASMDTIPHTPYSTVHPECFLLPAQDPYLNQVRPSNLTYLWHHQDWLHF